MSEEAAPQPDWDSIPPEQRRLLESIVLHAHSAIGYAERAGRAWASDEMVVDAVAKRVEEIGELAKRVDPAVRDTVLAVNWKGASAMRDMLAHDYANLKVDVLAEVVRVRLPPIAGIAIAEPSGPSVRPLRTQGVLFVGGPWDQRTDEYPRLPSAIAGLDDQRDTVVYAKSEEWRDGKRVYRIARMPELTTTGC